MSRARKGWLRVKFGEVVRLVTDRCDPIAAGIERFVGLEHLLPGDLRVRSWGLVAEGTTFTNQFRPGQVLFGKRRAYQKKLAVADFQGVCSGDIYVMEVRDPEVLHPDLLPYLCQTDAFFEHAVGTSAGSLSPRTTWTRLAEFEFALPLPEEQRRMLGLLTAAERAYQCAVDALEAANSMVAAHSAAVLRGADGGRTISHPVLGSVREEWPVMTVADVVALSQYGLSIAPMPTGKYPIIRMMNLVDGWVVENDLRYVTLEADTFRSYRLEHGDVLFNRTNSIDLVGRTGVYALEGDHVFASYLVRLRVQEHLVHPQYLTEYLNAPPGRQQVLRYATKAVSQANVSASNLAKVLLPVPPIRTQSRVVAEISDLESARQSCARRVREVAALKMSAIRELLGVGSP